MEINKDVEMLARAIVAGVSSDRQPGQPSYLGDGRWGFVSIGINLKPEEINAAFRILGQEPERTPQKGRCEECAHAELIRGRYVEQGYKGPCLTCVRPNMSNFEAREPALVQIEK